MEFEFGAIGNLVCIVYCKYLNCSSTYSDSLVCRTECRNQYTIHLLNHYHISLVHNQNQNQRTIIVSWCLVLKGWKSDLSENWEDNSHWSKGWTELKYKREGINKGLENFIHLPKLKVSFSFLCISGFFNFPYFFYTFLNVYIAREVVELELKCLLIYRRAAAKLLFLLIYI